MAVFLWATLSSATRVCFLLMKQQHDCEEPLIEFHLYNVGWIQIPKAHIIRSLYVAVLKITGLTQLLLLSTGKLFTDNGVAHKLELGTTWPDALTRNSVTLRTTVDPCDIVHHPTGTLVCLCVCVLGESFDWALMDLPLHLYCPSILHWSGLSMLRRAPSVNNLGRTAWWTQKGIKYVNIDISSLSVWLNVPVGV